MATYRHWFLSQVFSASGTMTRVVALSWLVLQLTHSGVDLGLLTTFALAPLLIGGPWAGALVDRVDRRRLLIVTQGLYIAIASTLALVTALGVARLWLIFALALASGMVGAPDGAARQVYANDLMGPGRLTSAVSLNEVVINVSRVLGPGLGGLLLATAGVAACCALNALSFVPSLVVLIVQRRTVVPNRPDPSHAHTHFLFGLRYALRNPTIRLVMLLAAASGMLFNLNVPLPLMATRVFHLGGGGYGLMMTVFGVGGTLGGLLAASGNAAPTRRRVVTLAACTGAAVIVTAAARGLGELYAGLAVTGCVSIWFVARANALVQFETEPALRGRVMAVWSMALPGCVPLLSPLVGWVSGAWGPRESFGGAGVALLVIVGVANLCRRRGSD